MNEEIISIRTAIKRACKYRHNSYYWDEEWDWIDKALEDCDIEINRLQSRIEDLESEVKRLEY